MSLDLLVYSSKIFIFWITLIGCLTGLGYLISSIFKLEINLNFLPWVGFLTLITFLEISNLFFSINIILLYIFILVSFVGIFHLLSEKFEKGIVFTKNKLIFLGIFIFITFWLANLASAPQLGYDAGLYHIQTIRWLQAGPVQFGLGNLHSRLGYNHNFHLLLALIDTVPRSDGAYYLGAGLLLSLAWFTVLFSIFNIPKYDIPNSRSLFSLLMFLLIPLFYISVHSTTNTTGEMPTYIFGILISIILSNIVSNKDISDGDIFLLLFLSLGGISMKLNFAVFSLSALLILIILLIQQSKIRGNIKNLLRLSSLPVLLLLFWIIRNIILTGYLAYPIPKLFLSLNWSIPKSAAVGEFLIILSWARNPGKPIHRVLGNWDWLLPWIKRNLNLRHDLLYLPLIILPLSLLLFILNFDKKNKNSILWLGFIITPNLASVLYWFFTAPDSRFLGVHLWIVVGALLSFGYNRFSYKKIVAAMVIFQISFVSIIYLATGNISLYNNKIIFIKEETRQISTYMYITESNIEIVMPTTGDQCWDAKLPCTPGVNPSLNHYQLNYSINENRFVYTLENNK